MSFITFICLLIFSAFLVSGFRSNANFLSPARIYGMLWSFIIGLLDYKFSKLQFRWDPIDWFYVLLGVLAFLLGIYISYILNINKKFLHPGEIRKAISNIVIDEKRLFNFIIIYFVIWLFCFVAEWQLEGYLPIFTINPDAARVRFGVFGLHVFVSSVNVVLFLIIQYFILVRANKTKKSFLILIFLISMGNYILIVQRYGFFILLMMAFCLYYYAGKKLSGRTIVIFASILILTVIGIQSLRISELVKAYIIIQSKIKFPMKYAELAIPYMYLSMNLENFVKYYPQLDNNSFGFFSTEFLSHLVGAKYFIADYFGFDKFKNYIGGYNTFPFFWPYYYDFGIFGLAFIPMALGFIASEVYYFLHRNPSLTLLAIYSVAFSVIMVTFNSDPLTKTDMVLSYFVIIMSQSFFVKKTQHSHQVIS
jgi:oligosaccharide repeat unit polymerase